MTAPRPCPLCGAGTLQPGSKTMTFERDGATVVVRAVPADVCDVCGEGSLTEEAVTRLADIVDDAVSRRVETEVLVYGPPVEVA